MLPYRIGNKKEIAEFLKRSMEQTPGKARNHLHTLSDTLSSRLRYRDFHRFSDVRTG
ncbi:hypothetical protein [Neisseria sicca]|uniref:hypothetical protein n=1 Tax=Neisseria sicca TaxID=490 RepID=UPI00164994EC|nr:hypothetical protein [Neisseria sicca]